jgi:hypothetical protein
MSETILRIESVLEKTAPPTPEGAFLAPEVRRRLAGHEQLVHRICALARQEAQDRGLVLRKMEVRPAWSHEADEHSGVVIDVELKATADERFSYWDAICERILQFETSLSQEEQRFLDDEISLVVSRS